MYFHFLNLITLLVYLNVAVSVPVLQRTNTPHPKKKGGFRFPGAAKIASTVESKINAENEAMKVQHVKALVCLKCILQFDEFKAFYSHKCKI